MASRPGNSPGYHRPMHSPHSPASSRVEAARYALLRRLAMAMRHQMLVHLQPIDLITHVIERRLRQPAPDLERIGADMEKVSGFAREAVGANLDVISWLAPEPAQQVALDAGVEQCVLLLRSHFSFRGFGLQHAAPGGSVLVARTALRTLLPAVLLALADEAHAPAELVIRRDDAAQRPALEVLLQQGAGPRPEPVQPPYRLLAWDEVQALAEAEGVALRRTAAGAHLEFPSA